MREVIGKFVSPMYGQVTMFKSHYSEGQLAVFLETDNCEPLAVLSVNMYKPECSQDSKDLPPDCFYVKDWSENEQLAQECFETGLFLKRPDLPPALSGYVSAEVWQLKG